ncbi:MAG: hypothetical protein AB1345_14210 [Chloroflexota bacterium]
MGKNKLLPVLGVVLLTVACTLGGASTPVQGLPAGSALARCGDGVCSGPEDESNCPGDCPAGAEPLPQPPVVPGDASQVLPGEGNTPPLVFFYAIHTHANGDFLPYTTPAMSEINPQAAENMLAAINGIREVLNRHGVKATWELVYGTAKWLCGMEGDILAQLQAEGHEIATHAHQVEDTITVTEILRQQCGIHPNTASGFILYADQAGGAGAQQAVVNAVQLGLDLGFNTGTENLSPGGNKNPFSVLCNQQIGVGNDMWAQTGNLMFPWRPDVANGNICADDPRGEMVFVDHVSIEWTIAPDGRQSEVLSDSDFARLQAMFEAALAYMETNRPERLAAWGFVTHITEYSPGGGTSSPPSPQALAALDGFLAYVAEKAAEGRVIFATANEIAEAFRTAP